MSAAGGAGVSGRGSATGRMVDCPLPILRTTSKYNKNQIDVKSWDKAKLTYACPVTADGKPGFYRDGLDGISVPLMYNGDFAMNTGFVLRKGKFEIATSTLKADDTYQLVAHYPVRSVDELGEVDPSDPRKDNMAALLQLVHETETLVQKWIVDDAAGRLFGVAYTAADLAAKTRLDGKKEKGKFSSLIYSGTAKTTGEPMLLKSYFKLPTVKSEDGSPARAYCEFTLDGESLPALIPTLIEHVNWRNDVGIVFSLRDIYKSAYGIGVRVRIDIIGAWPAPKPAIVPIFNPFSAGTRMLED